MPPRSSSRSSSSRSDRSDRPGGKYRRTRRRVCAFCADKIEFVDYKNAIKLRKYISERGKILPRRTTGTCASHQRVVTHAIKRAREIALLPFAAE